MGHLSVVLSTNPLQWDQPEQPYPMGKHGIGSIKLWELFDSIKVELNAGQSCNQTFQRLEKTSELDNNNKLQQKKLR